MQKQNLNFKELNPFLIHFYKLKEIKRTGWKVKLSIDNGESVAEHTLAMIVLSLIYAEYNNLPLSKTIKMIKMALIHDLGESITGDHIPESIRIKKKKHLESKAIRDIFSKIPNKRIRKRYLKIWKEFDNNMTDISKKIHLIDKLEMAIQARYYLDKDNKIRKKDIKPFFDSALRYIINNNKKIKGIHDGNKEIKKMDEIEQILLYLNK